MKIIKKLSSKIFLAFIICSVIGVIAYSNRHYLTILSNYTKQYIEYLNQPDMEWTMVNVNHTNLQGDAHLIKVKGGKTILIDAGFNGPANEKLVPFLIKNQIKQFDYVFISHPHRDHYEGLWAILKNNIKIKEVFFNIPDKDVCDREIPWGCNYHDVLTFHKMLKHYGVKITQAEAGQNFDLGNDISIGILYAYDGVNTPVGKTDINDMSLIMMLKTNDYKFLFTGDLNRKLGSYLADNAKDIEAHVLKVPHHGGEGLAPNSFFEKVNPEIAMVPGPKWIWCDKKRNRARHWFLDKNIPAYVNGFQGSITIKYKDGKLEVITENKEAIRC